MDLPNTPDVKSGVFPNRSQAQPNPITITIAYLLNVDEESGPVDLAYIDAFDCTPMVDINPYLLMSALVLSVKYPDWMEGFPDSMEEAVDFFSDPENIKKFS